MLLDIANAENRGLTLPPMSLFISGYLDTMKVMEGRGLSRKAMKKLIEKQNELTDYAFELEAERKESLRQKAQDRGE
jgi:hypothetical protein